MDKLEDGGPAFPQWGLGAPSGLTLRDWFAGQALAGLLREYPWGRAAMVAYQLADAMLAARKDRG